MIRYFVSYVASLKSGVTYGWADITRAEPIVDGHDVQAVTAELQRAAGGQVSVLAWQRFEEPS